MFASAIFAPGTVIDPNCLPTDPDCTVSTAWTTAITALNFTGTSTGTNTGDETTSTIKSKLSFASSSADGYLVSSDWTTFNNKQSALTFVGALVNNSGSVSMAGDTDTPGNLKYFGTNVTGDRGFFDLPTGGAVSTTTWGFIEGTLANQTDLQNALNLKANLSTATFTGPISAQNFSGTSTSINTGDETTSTIKSKLSITTLSGDNTGDETTNSIKTKLGTTSSTTDGYLTSTDWITFNSKQSAGAYLTAITGTNLDNIFSSNGLLKRTGAGTYTVDSNTYLTSFTESDPIWSAASSSYLTTATASSTYAKLSAPIFSSILSSGDIQIGTGSTSANLDFRDTDVTHGITTIANTNTYGLIKEMNSTKGGLSFSGFSDTSDNSALELRGFVTSDPDVGVSSIVLDSYAANGTGVTALGAAKTILSVQNNGVEKIKVLGNGNTTFSGTISATNFTGTSTGINTGDLSLVSASSTGLILSGQALSLTSGYSIPLTASTTNWNNIYNTVIASSTNWNTAYTSRISSASSPLSFSNNILSISLSSSTSNGYLSSTDWNIFNNKLSTSTASSTYAPLTNVLTLNNVTTFNPSGDYNPATKKYTDDIFSTINNRLAPQMNNQKTTGVLLPLYIYPSDIYTNVEYNRVIDLAKKYKEIPTIAIVNPGSGPGTVVDGNYTAAIARLQGADITTIGYVSTAYMVNSLTSVKADVDKWIALYPKIRGIFYDEMLNFADGTHTTEDIITYYKKLYNYAKNTKHLDVVFVNPGTTYDYEIWEAGVADNYAIYEESGYPSEATLKQEGAWAGALIEQPASMKAAIVYGVSSYSDASVKLIKKYNGWVFVTNQTLPNPYGVLTPYLENMYQSLSEGSDTATTFTIGTTTSLATLTVSGNARISDIFTVASTTGTSTVLGKLSISTSSSFTNLTVDGGLMVTGKLFDNAYSAGTAGMVLQSTGTGYNWVATSSLGIPNSLTITNITASGTATVGNLYTNVGATTEYVMTLPSGSTDGSTIGFLNVGGANGIYTSQYPPAQSSTYVKATHEIGSYFSYLTTDPSKSLVGNEAYNQWLGLGNPTNMRFHIDLGSAKAISRIYYENGHNSGGTTNEGVKNFTFWGSNSATAFSTLTYSTDTGWTQITTATTQFEQHVAINQADPKYITVTNATPYRYYAFKFADNWGNGVYASARRIELQTGGASYITVDPDVSESIYPYANGVSVTLDTEGSKLSLIKSNGKWYDASFGVGMAASNPSSRSVKENFIQLDKQDILNKIARLDMTEWNYISQDDGITHIGPIAEDFYANFGLGGTDKSISTIDPAGIALVGIQQLNKNFSAIFGTSSLSAFAESTTTMETYTVTDFFASMVKSALQKLSSTFIDTILSVKGMVIGSASQPSGLTIYDQTTKEPYCMKINNGAVVTSVGVCSDSSISSPSPALSTDSQAGLGQAPDPSVIIDPIDLSAQSVNIVSTSSDPSSTPEQSPADPGLSQALPEETPTLSPETTNGEDTISSSTEFITPPSPTTPTATESTTSETPLSTNPIATSSEFSSEAPAPEVTTPLPIAPVVEAIPEPTPEPLVAVPAEIPVPETQVVTE